MDISDLSLVLFRKILVVSVDVKNFTSSSLGQLLLGLNLPSPMKSIIALVQLKNQFLCK